MPLGTARLEDLLDHDAVLAGELVRVLAHLVGVGVLGHGDAECTADALALTLAELGAVQRADGGAADGRRAASPAGRRARRPRRSGENWPLRRVAMTTRGGPSVANASSKAARASSLVIAIAIAMFGRITPSSRGRRGRIVVLMSVLMSKVLTRPRAGAFPLDTNVRSLYYRTHVRFALSPPPRLGARRLRLPRRARPARAAGLVLGRAPGAPARRAARRDALGDRRRRLRRRHAIPTSRRSRAPVTCTAR